MGSFGNRLHTASRSDSRRYPNTSIQHFWGAINDVLSSVGGRSKTSQFSPGVGPVGSIPTLLQFHPCTVAIAGKTLGNRVSRWVLAFLLQGSFLWTQAHNEPCPRPHDVHPPPPCPSPAYASALLSSIAGRFQHPEEFDESMAISRRNPLGSFFLYEIACP